MTAPSVSVVIATRDRPELLEGCLRSLTLQADTDFEVVVVDDGSACDLRPAVEPAAALGLQVSVLRRDPKGLSAARNAGTRTAAGEVVAYLDDDALASTAWIGEMRDAFDRTGCDAVAGRIELAFDAPPPRWLRPGLRAFLAELDLGPELRALGPGETPFGANCAVRRAAFEDRGGFSARLGRAGASLRSNEEVAFFRALANRGGLVVYQPGALVWHRVSAERVTAEYLLRRAYAQGQSDVAIEPPGAWRREVLRAARTPGILAKGLARDGSTVAARAWLGYCRGRWAARRSGVGL